MTTDVATRDRTTEVLSLLRCRLSLTRSTEDLLHDYRSAKPFPHLVLDNLFPADELTALADEIPPESSETWVHERNERIVKANLRSAVYLGEHGYTFYSMLHSAAFLYFLTEITGIKALLPDPYLTGGGYHVMREGGKFELHADRNTDHYCGLERRLAMLVYLNKSWRTDLGGQLELWNKDGTRCERVIEPTFNRTLIFEVGDANFHAVRPVASGVGARRATFAAYFHTVNGNLISHNSIYAPSIYRDREGMLHRLGRNTVPPFLWQVMKTLKRLRRK